MAKDVELGKKKADLMARVTGAAPSSSAPRRPAQPASLPSGMSGRGPLPAGKVLTAGTGAVVASGSSMTPQERATLEAVGLSDAEIPANMAALLAEEAARQAAESQEVMLPPNFKRAAIPPPVALENLDEKSAQRIGKAVEEALVAQKVQAARSARLAQESALNTRTPGITAAMQVADAASGLQIDDDVTTAPAPAPLPSSAPAPLPSSPPPVSASDTGAAVAPTRCPHCNWLLALPDVAEPVYGEKMMFLHALLGQKCYSKEVHLFGGAVSVTFRTLTPREMEAIYRQAFLDREAGKLKDDLDFWEKINRYRLFLQIQLFRSGGNVAGIVHDLPDGLSPETNSSATAFWRVTSDVADSPPAGGTMLPLIEEWLLDNVLKTEALYRVVAAACGQFNRLVAKMEAMADSSDFWSPTAGPS